MAARGLPVDTMRFATGFGRGLDYYTGFVFDLHGPEGEAQGPIVGGGRYDQLMTRLGAPDPIPAVGFAVWIDRLSRLPHGNANLTGAFA
jgi:ATP phosphoribosyltransferase regulatory subunit